MSLSKFRYDQKGITRACAVAVTGSSGLVQGAPLRRLRYLSGYVVELALKARVCRILKLTEYPQTGDLAKAFKVHSLEQLKILAGLNKEIDVAKNKVLFDNWSKAVEWNPEQRYQVPGKYNAAGARVILESLTDKPNGVFTWLSKRW